MNLKNTTLGIELGSTRIKAVLIDDQHVPLASGAFEWENQLVNGVWTYPLDLVWTGIQACFSELRKEVRAKYGEELRTVGAIGVSAMMHGYLPFDQEGRQLAEFRTWRNRMTSEAAEKLSALFGFVIPQRYSIAHFYQAILNGESHVKDVAHLMTLAVYVHWKLTGRIAAGIGEASGMFPVDNAALDYDEGMLQKFRALTGIDLRPLLPEALIAGEPAGVLTPEGARLLDPSGTLQPGIPFAPCEGDAQTGMTATNSVRVRTGNVSAGTSIFAMLVTDKTLGMHREVDVMKTPEGNTVAMVHSANCSSDLNAWINLFAEFCAEMGFETTKQELFIKMFSTALRGDADGGGLLSYNYVSGEGIANLSEGRPVFLRTPDAHFTLPNFMRTHVMAALATLSIGLGILTKDEQVEIDRLCGHGGFFKTPVVGQYLLSAAAGAPVSVMETAGEGGPYGMALLAAYMLWKEADEKLADYLDNKVFKNAHLTTLMAAEKDIEGFQAYLERYRKALPVERTAVEVLSCWKS